MLATAAVLVLAALALPQGDSALTSLALPWLLAAGIACAVAAAAWAMWRQRHGVDSLRTARLEAQGLIDIAEGWHWRIDSAHRLTQLQPPATATDRDWASPGALGRPLWEHFNADPIAAAALRARLDAGTRLDGHKVRRQLDDGTVQQFELRGIALSDSRGRAVGYLGSARALGVGAAPEAERRLLDALLTALPLPAVVLVGTSDTPTHLLFGNEAAAQLLGLAPSQLAGMTLSELQSRLSPDRRAALADALAPSGPASERRLAGPAGPAEATLSRIDAASLPAGASGNAEGRWLLTFASAAGGPEPSTAAAAAAAAAAEHESFSYTVSHDLRAPIRVVEGFTKILKEDYGRQLDRIGNDHLDRVLGAAARMNSMVDALLALSQLSSRPLSRQPVNLSQLATYVMEDLRRQSPERTVAVHIEPGLQTQGDPTLLRMVLENLLGNAWKYSAKKPAAQIWLERGLHDGQPVYTVRDNGAGFDMRFADRLFGVFQRLHSATDFPGTGVGLASVRRIVSRHGGEIWAESAVERGSSFHFTLPAGNAAG